MNTGEEIAGTAFKEVARRFSKMVNRMTLDEAIKHCEETSKFKSEEGQEARLQEQDKYAEECFKCAEEYRQLAEWLKELKEFRLLLGTVESARWLYESWERYGEEK